MRELVLLGAGGDLEFCDSGVFLAVPNRPRRPTIPNNAVPPLTVALGWLWESAIDPFRVSATGEAPALFRARDDTDSPYELASLSGSFLLWDQALTGRTVVSGIRERDLVGPPRNLARAIIDEAGDRTRAVFSGSQWAAVCSGVELFYPALQRTGLDRLRRLMMGGLERGFAELRGAACS